MPAILVSEQELCVGNELVVEGPAPTPPFEAVFEDDGETGYFYALDHLRSENPIVDALHVYNVEDVADRKLPSQVRIVWAPDHLHVALLINDYPHAVFDFVARRGYCRNGFPPECVSDAGWSVDGHEWDDSALDPFL